MNRLLPSVKKEFLLLMSDKVGLLFMFAMPLLLVFILTAVQESAFRRINENIITAIIVNQDAQEPAQQFVQMLYESGMFVIEEKSNIPQEDIKNTLLKSGKLVAIYIPTDFTEKLTNKAVLLSEQLLIDMELLETGASPEELEMPQVAFYHDPILQEAYSHSIVNVINTYLNAVENMLFLEVLYQELGFDKKPENFQKTMQNNRVGVSAEPASITQVKPNATQHNVPAWTIFAMFFIVVSLGNNIVKERLNGSLIRLKTMPAKFRFILGGKMLVYLGVALLQLVAIFSIGVFVFPLINLPSLQIPSNIFLLIFVTVSIALAAISYALMIGALSKTQEQANGIGAVSIIIFAALGGILVPVFAMPPFLKSLSVISPLRWCLEGFYHLFLRGGDALALLKVFWPVWLFIVLCQVITYIRFKAERIV